MSNTRRAFIKKSLLLPGLVSTTLGPSGVYEQHTSDSADIDRLVLLGTQGGPFIRSYKQTPSANLIVYKNVPFVIDTGYGVTFKLRDAGVTLSTLKYIFITHHHSDHNLELGPLFYNAWIAGLKDPIHIYAPAGLTTMLAAYWESMRFDIDTRIRDEGRPDIRTLAVGHEVTESKLISNDDFEVSCLKNIHPPINESFCYKFKLGKQTVVFSGDTTYCPALINFASGVDYLIHEVMYTQAVNDMIKRRPNATKLIASIKSHHTSTDDVGRIAKGANVKTLILNHFVPPDDASLTEEVWLSAVRKNFDGNVVVGRDLLQFELK